MTAFAGPTSQEEISTVKEHVVNSKKELPRRTRWVRVIVVFLAHMASLYGLYLGFWAHRLTWLWTFIMFMFGGIGITGGLHRLWAHRSYKAKTPLRILLTCMASSAQQDSIIGWSRTHRVHHKFSETDADPHNAKNGFFFAHIGWLLQEEHPLVTIQEKKMDMSDLYADPILAFQDKFYLLLTAIFTYTIPTLVPHLCWGENLKTAFFVACVLRLVIGLNFVGLVNSAAHFWGNRPYDKHINPADNRIVSITSFGEGFHNYHHVFPQDYSTSEFGWKLNITTVFIDTMAYLGQVTDRKMTSAEIIKRRKQRTGEAS